MIPDLSGGCGVFSGFVPANSLYLSECVIRRGTSLVTGRHAGFHGETHVGDSFGSVAEINPLNTPHPPDKPPILGSGRHLVGLIVNPRQSARPHAEQLGECDLQCCRGVVVPAPRPQDRTTPATGWYQLLTNLPVALLTWILLNEDSIKIPFPTGRGM
jgi:hypothetical protein